MEGQEKTKRKIVPRDIFVQAVLNAKLNGTGIKGIAAETGLAESSVNTRLSGLRKQIGKDSVPNFQSGGGNKISEAEKQKMRETLAPALTV